MSRMFTAERQQRILAELVDQQRVEVAALAAALHVSEDTIRRDLRALAERGYLHKTHGGAIALDPGHMRSEVRAQLRTEAKRIIASTVAALVEPGQTLMLDAGSTVLALARELETRPLIVITNSLDVAAHFQADRRVALTVAGGTWNPDMRYLTGSDTVTTLSGLRADWAFLGACALHPEAGITSVSDEDAAVKRAMLHAARRTVVLADATKLGQVAPYLVAPLAAVHAVATDDPDAGPALREAGALVL